MYAVMIQLLLSNPSKSLVIETNAVAAIVPSTWGRKTANIRLLVVSVWGKRKGTFVRYGE